MRNHSATFSLRELNRAGGKLIYFTSPCSLQDLQLVSQRQECELESGARTRQVSQMSEGVFSAEVRRFHYQGRSSVQVTSRYKVNSQFESFP